MPHEAQSKRWTEAKLLFNNFISENRSAYEMLRALQQIERTDCLDEFADQFPGMNLISQR